MDEQVAKYLKMLEQSDPAARIIGLDCMYTYDPQSGLLEGALKKMAIFDGSEEVRLKSIDLIIKLFKTTSNKGICQFLAQIVDNKEELNSCRVKAYFAMKMICFTPPHQIEKKVEALFAKVKEVTDMQKIFSPAFNIERDADWLFIETFRV